MSSNRTKQQVSEKQPEPSALRKIHLRIDKVKLILQEKDKNFYDKHNHLFGQLEEPRQRFIDTINLSMDDGTTKTVKLFLVQHNLAFGPGQGVLRFIKDVYIPSGVGKTSLQRARDVVDKLLLEQVETLATDASLNHALHNVKLGGASCAVAFMEVREIGGRIQTIPLHLTKFETAKLSREIGYRLAKYRIMGPYGFWPEPDNVTTDEQILNLVEDEALRTLLVKRLLTPSDKELLETLDKVYGRVGEKNKIRKKFKNTSEILETPYHDAALTWLKEWRLTRRGGMAMEELVSETSKAGKHHRELLSKTARKYQVMPSIAEDILAVKRLLAVMYLPFKDYKPNGQIVIMDTGIAPAIVQSHLSGLSELAGEDVVIISVLSKRLGGSSPKRIEQLCRIYVEAAYNLGAKIVTLCNTMDSNARAIISKEFSIPILGPIVPAVEAALRFGKAMNIGVIATKATIGSGIYVREIKKHDPEAKVFSVVAPLLATMVDLGESDTMQPPSMNQETIAIIEANLRPLTGKNIDTLILGCTHYSVFEQTISEIWKRCTGKEIHIVDSSRELSHYTLTYLKQNKMLSLRAEHKGKLSYMASEDDAQRFERSISEITGCTAGVMPIDIGEVVGRLSEEDRLFQKTVVKESKEDINLRGVIINSSLSAGAKVAIADKLYGAGSIDTRRSNGEILPLELQEEYITEMDKLAAQDKELSKILLHIKELLSNKAK